MATQFKQLVDRLNAIHDSLREVGSRLDAEVAYDPTMGKGTRTRPDASPMIEAARRQLEQEMRKAGDVLKKFPKKSNGIIPDDVKNSTEYRQAKKMYDQTFAALRAFNSKYKPGK